jgi:hypothetical protein
LIISLHTELFWPGVKERSNPREIVYILCACNYQRESEKIGINTGVDKLLVLFLSRQYRMSGVAWSLLLLEKVKCVVCVLDVLVLVACGALL